VYSVCGCRGYTGCAAGRLLGLHLPKGRDAGGGKLLGGRGLGACERLHARAAALAGQAAACVRGCSARVTACLWVGAGAGWRPGPRPADARALPCPPAFPQADGAASTCGTCSGQPPCRWAGSLPSRSARRASGCCWLLLTHRCPAACRYYLNGDDAYRLKLLLPLSPEDDTDEALLQLQHHAEVML
jgi:hypothetical protein